MNEKKLDNIIINDQFMQELEKPKIENELLKSSFEDANKTIAKLINSDLNMFLSQQKLILNK